MSSNKHHGSATVREDEDSNSYQKMRSSLCWLPIVLTLSTAIGFGISYIWAVLNGDVNPLWPYISDTGGQEPESCIFGQLLNFTAFLAMATVYVRYKLVQAFNNYDARLKLMNRIGIGLGALSALGVSLVANFQDSYVISVHLVGASMAFGLGVVYCFVHSAITKRMCPMYNGRYIWILRLLISFAGLLALILTVAFAGLASSAAGSLNSITDFNRKWNSTEPGYDEHIVSTVSEWIIGVAFMGFFLTYTRDFQKITMRILPELLVSHLDETPIVFNTGPTERTGLLA